MYVRTYVLHTYVCTYNSLEDCHDLGLGVLLLNELCLLNAAFTVTSQGQAGHAWFRDHRHTEQRSLPFMYQCIYKDLLNVYKQSQYGAIHIFQQKVCIHIHTYVYTYIYTYIQWHTCSAGLSTAGWHCTRLTRSVQQWTMTTVGSNEYPYC